MENWGDFQKTANTIHLSFNTVSQSGIAAGITNGGVVALNNSLLTVVSGTGIDLSGNIGGRTGLHIVALNLAHSNLVTGYNYSIYLSSGTIDSKDVSNRIVGTFSIGRYASTSNLDTVVDASLNDFTGSFSTVMLAALSSYGAAMQAISVTIGTNLTNFSGSAVKRNINYTWTTPSGTVVTMISGGS